MAAGGLLALLDDITTLLDDVAVLSKVAAGKTAGISGDDLAVNSQMLIGIDPKRELPIVWSVAKGSFKNKLFLIPGALALNFALPAAITPILMLGGAYLCYEGMEKTLHFRQTAGDVRHHEALTAAALKSTEALQIFERDKIRGAINTDLILSGEIIAVTLGTVATSPFVTQVIVLSTIGIAITVGIYGLVAGIVKLDDLGLHLVKTRGSSLFAKTMRWLGGGLIQAAPKLMKFLAVAGTAAMLLVGGELIIHGIPGTEHFMHGPLGMVYAVVAGVIIGLCAIPAVKAAKKLYKKYGGKLKPVRRRK